MDTSFGEQNAYSKVGPKPGKKKTNTYLTNLYPKAAVNS